MSQKIPDNHPLEGHKYTVITPQIVGFQKMVEFLIEFSLPGMIGYGPARVGKTTSINAVTQMISEKYRGQIAIMETIIDTHRKGENRLFFEEFCRNLGLEWHVKRPSGSELRSLVIEYMIMEGRKNGNKVLLIVDEASKMVVEDYDYMMDVYNRLEKNGVSLICVLVGTEKLLETKKEMSWNVESQVVGRFMVNEFEFSPVKDIEELRQILNGFDTHIKYDGRSLTEDLFPESFKEGKRLGDEAESIEKAIVTIKRERASEKKRLGITKGGGINMNQMIQMQYLIMTIEMIMKKQGRYSGKEKWPTEKDWLETLKLSGFPHAI